MDIHVILTIGEYAFRRITTGWFLRLLAGGALILLLLLFQSGPNPIEMLLDARASSIGLISVITTVLVIVMGATELPRDIETRTILIILSRPLTKSDVVLGKFVGLVYVATFTVLTLTSVVLLGIITKAHMEGTSLPPDLYVMQSSCFSLLQAILVAAIVMLLSTRLTEIPIIFFSAFYILLGYVIANIHAFLLMPHLILPVKIALRLIYFIAPNMRYFEIPPQAGLQATVGWDHFFLAFAYCLVYSFLLLLFAVRSFNKREVAG